MLPKSEIEALAQGFGLPPVREINRLVPGTDRAIKLTTTDGAFVLKPAYDERVLPVLAEAADLLVARGLTHPRIRSTKTGRLMVNGWFLQEFVRGDPAVRPTTAQCDAAMRYLDAFLTVLADVNDVSLPATVWVDVTDPGWLVENLVPLSRECGPSVVLPVVDIGTRLLADCAAQLRDLPHQLVHGDVGPDQFLWAEDNVVALVDFTPFWESALFAVACALYWFDVRQGANAATIMRHFEMVRPWSAPERRLMPFALLREALRRVATPLAVPPPTDLFEYIAPRIAGLQRTLALLPRLQTAATQN